MSIWNPSANWHSPLSRRCRVTRGRRGRGPAVPRVVGGRAGPRRRNAQSRRREAALASRHRHGRGRHRVRVVASAGGRAARQIRLDPPPPRSEQIRPDDHHGIRPRGRERRAERSRVLRISTPDGREQGRQGRRPAARVDLDRPETRRQVGDRDVFALGRVRPGQGHENIYSFRSPDQPVPFEDDPRRLFERMFRGRPAVVPNWKRRATAAAGRASRRPRLRRPGRVRPRRRRGQGRPREVVSRRPAQVRRIPRRRPRGRNPPRPARSARAGWRRPT